jgi:hypothetical protein
VRLIGSVDLLYTHEHDAQSRWQALILQPASPVTVNLVELGWQGRLSRALAVKIDTWQAEILHTLGRIAGAGNEEPGLLRGQDLWETAAKRSLALLS